MSSSAPQRPTGILAPVLTPVRTDLSPDTERWIEHCRWLLDSGCHGLCPFGTTSEATSFGVEERMEMLERLLNAGIPAEVLMPGVGMCAFPETVRLASHAVKLGCSGVLMLPPFYYKAVDDDGIFRSVAEVIERVGDDRLRVYLYHIPPIAVVGYSVVVIERLLAAYPNTVAGIKDSSADWSNLRTILDCFPGFGTFSGTEKFLLQTLRMGGAGTITAMANVVPGLLRTLYDNYLADNAEELQADASAMRNALTGYAPIPALKQIVAYRREDPGWLHVRPPLTQYSSSEATALLDDLKDKGLI
jgi:4-hydroxy-tetrahydrodipicolinate synthase